MDIILHISEIAAKALRRQLPMDDASKEILEIAHKFGVDVKALHSNTNDTHLMKDFFIEVETQNEADRVANAFLRCSAVEGAYAKEQGEAPK